MNQLKDKQEDYLQDTVTHQHTYSNWDWQTTQYVKGDAWTYNILTSVTNDTQWNASQQNWP